MFTIIKRDLLSILRDKGTLFMIVFFPSIMVFLLGSLLSNLDNSDSVISTITIQYCVQTTDPFDVAAIDSFTGALDDNDSVQMVACEDTASARTEVDEKRASAAVVFTQPFGVEIFEGYDQTQNRAIASIFTGFVRETASLQTVARYAPNQLEEAIRALQSRLVEQEEFALTRSMLDYYAVTMAVMILFMSGAIGGAATLYEGRKDGTLARVVTSPRSTVNLYIQHVVSAIPYNLIQVVCVMVASVFLFGAHYAQTFMDNLLLFTTLTCVGMCVTAAMMILGLFIRVNPQVVIMSIMWVLMFISGTFSKEVYIENFTEYSPIWMIQNAAFDLTVFGRSEKCLQVLVISVALLAMFTFIGALLFRRKGVAIK